MSNQYDPFQVIKSLNGHSYYSLKALEQNFEGNTLESLPISIRIVLESVLRNCDGTRISEQDVVNLANWNATNTSDDEIPFVVSRVILQDFTGVPLLVDLAAMRDAARAQGKDPSTIEPLVPVDLVIDHSVQVDRSGTVDAFKTNLNMEFKRNQERYEFLKWGQQAFETFNVVPPSIGIVHQVNLEHLARVVFEKDGVLYPDTLVGTDSHTTMINGLGIVGWGVGGIEAESAMLGQPVYFKTPEVIGVNLEGELPKGATATDLTLRITELLRAEKVVGKFVEFHGEGAKQLSLADRATISNMAPEYGATMGFFPIDEKSLEYLRLTGRDESKISLIKNYLSEQGLFGIPEKGTIHYSKTIDLNLSEIVPAVAGPKRPQDLIAVTDLKDKFKTLIDSSVADGGFNLDSSTLDTEYSFEYNHSDKKIPSNLKHGQVLIAAITSCTNTSNPSVMIAAGLVAKKAHELGLSVNPLVKTSLAPGSRVVTDYLNETKLQPYLDALGFNLVGYGCTTCIGNSGPLNPSIEEALKEYSIVGASVLSGNRNFEARVHGAIKANFLMSPPLVVAYALAGNVNIDLSNDPIGIGSENQEVYLKDIWPTQSEIDALIESGLKPEMFLSKYSDLKKANEEWNAIESPEGLTYDWNPNSTYIQNPPFFNDLDTKEINTPDLDKLRPLAIVADSITTDHISPAGAIKEDSPAGRYLTDNNVSPINFNSFGSRRGNDRIMTRGTFANIRFKNIMADGKEGGFTKLMPEGTPIDIYDASQIYHERNTGLIIFAGEDYGMGSSRDWAAKGTALLGVRAVVAKSFERIHRSNLIGMGVLPLEFPKGVGADTLKLTGEETFSLADLSRDLKPAKQVTLEIKRTDGTKESITLTLRIDTPIEVEYYEKGGILKYVLSDLMQKS
ncbi:MAG: aconitate hydratase AcnA [Coraliomargaritaceae bacterium]